MAIRDISQKQTKTTRLNKHVAFPKDRVSLCCIKEEATTSKSGNPMVVRTFEFVTESVDLPDGSKLLLAGNQLTRYYALKSSGTAKSTPEEATANLVDQFRDDTNKCVPDNGIDWTKFDDENPPLVMQGKTVDALVGDDAQVERRPAKPGQRMGDPIKGADGKPITTHQAKIMEFYGPSVTKVNAPY